MSHPPQMRVDFTTCEEKERKHDVFFQLIPLLFIKKGILYYYLFFSCFMGIYRK